MSTIAINRSTSRKYLASLLQTALVGTGKPAQVVYAYKKGSIKGQSPVVMVTSGGSGRKHVGYTTNYENSFSLVILVWVLYADATAGWTESDAEDALDLIEKTIADVLATNKSVTGYWRSIDTNGPSQVLDANNLGGSDYILEAIPVMVEVDDA